MVNKLRVLIYLYRDDLTKALFFFWQAIICKLLLCLYYHEKVKSKSISYSVVYNSLPSHGLEPTRSLCPWNSSVKNMGVGCHSLFQGIFPTQELNLGLSPALKVDSLPSEALGKAHHPYIIILILVIRKAFISEDLS